MKKTDINKLKKKAEFIWEKCKKEKGCYSCDVTDCFVKNKKIFAEHIPVEYTKKQYINEYIKENKKWKL